MKNKKFIAGSIIVLLILGWFLPLGNYTTTKGCPIDIAPPTERLHLIFGDSIEEIKNNDVEPPPNVGCAMNTKYVLYFL